MQVWACTLYCYIKIESITVIELSLFFNGFVWSFFFFIGELVIYVCFGGLL